MKHIMIDIETLGTTPGFVVPSIAAVQFDLKSGKIGKDFQVGISTKDSVCYGLLIDQNTVNWWKRQSEEAKAELKGLKKLPLAEALGLFSKFLHKCGKQKDLILWGNSARFDLGMIERLYQLTNLKLPWNSFNERDVRTLVDLNPSVKATTPFTGIKHNAIDDCKFQIEYCYNTFNQCTTEECKQKTNY